MVDSQSEVNVMFMQRGGPYLFISESLSRIKTTPMGDIKGLSCNTYKNIDTPYGGRNLYASSALLNSY